MNKQIGWDLSHFAVWFGAVTVAGWSVLIQGHIT